MGAQPVVCAILTCTQEGVGGCFARSRARAGAGVSAATRGRPRSPAVRGRRTPAAPARAASPSGRGAPRPRRRACARRSRAVRPRCAARTRPGPRGCRRRTATPGPCGRPGPSGRGEKAGRRHEPGVSDRDPGDPVAAHDVVMVVAQLEQQETDRRRSGPGRASEPAVVPANCWGRRGESGSVNADGAGWTCGMRSFFLSAGTRRAVVPSLYTTGRAAPKRGPAPKRRPAPPTPAGRRLVHSGEQARDRERGRCRQTADQDRLQRPPHAGRASCLGLEEAEDRQR